LTKKRSNHSSAIDGEGIRAGKIGAGEDREEEAEPGTRRMDKI